jgi:hypothetical protein
MVTSGGVAYVAMLTEHVRIAGGVHSQWNFRTETYKVELELDDAGRLIESTCVMILGDGADIGERNGDMHSYTIEDIPAPYRTEELREWLDRIKD